MNDEKPEENKKRAKRSVRDAYASLGKEFGQINEEGKRERQEAIRDGITRIESEKKDQIFASRLVSDQISDLRKEANMSSSVGTSGQISKPKVFGKSDYKEALARELLVIGHEELVEAGGTITLSGLLELFKTTRPNWEIDINQIKNALKHLEKQEIIPKMQPLEKSENDTLVFFKPIELSSDLQILLKFAPRDGENVSYFMSVLGWKKERLLNALDSLIQFGLAILDEETSWIYFPALSK
ncbi:MAG: hypothetical protein ACTSYA_06815 [Candidatus Kariarchaeaceae archaeon]